MMGGGGGGLWGVSGKMDYDPGQEDSVGYRDCWSMASF